MIGFEPVTSDFGNNCFTNSATTTALGLVIAWQDETLTKTVLIVDI